MQNISMFLAIFRVKRSNFFAITKKLGNNRQLTEKKTKKNNLDC